MDDLISLILHGCRLAKDLESNLPNLANQPPNLLSRSFDDIINIFHTAKERLNALPPSSSPSLSPSFFYPAQTSTQLSYHPSHPHLNLQSIDPTLNLQEWLRSSVTQAMEGVIQTQLFPDHKTPFTIRPHQTVADVQAMDVSDSVARPGSSSSQRHRRSDQNARTIRVPAPRIGNTEIPPEDGFTWRKYGQKEILHSKFPRSYYRCTHQKLYQCPAKKQVQRLDDDPFTFEVTYNGEHTCHMSSTAPSSAEITQSTAMLEPSPANLGTWLSMDVGAAAAGGSGSSSTMVGGYRSSGTGGDVSQKDGDQYMVANMADAMFNSGSSSNSMEFLFPSMDEKWKPEAEEKKD
uniref:WRKY transcription factor 55 n=1 Tax=Canarium album TaxID=300208 RepID=A0A385JFL2_9ROSI|nr:WRKY transcription factor 55 [Canarium album]